MTLSESQVERFPIAHRSNMKYLGILAGLVLLVQGSFAEAGCPPWRPCGPGNTWGGNKLCAQGFYGADFRPACQRHDECYESGCCNRKACDQQFYHDMCEACECSTNPAACRRKAKMYYTAARLFGWMY